MDLMSQVTASVLTHFNLKYKKKGFFYKSSDHLLFFTDAVCDTHQLKLDQTADPGYPCNPGEALNSVDMDLSRSQKQTPTSSQAHGVCLTLNDHDRIRQFIQEFTFRGLLPHIEKNIRQLNDQVFFHLRTRTHPHGIHGTYCH